MFHSEIDGCEVCGNLTTVEVLNLGEHPMCDDLIKVGDKRKCKEYPIVLTWCAICKTVHQKFQIPKKTLFPKTYHYRARHTKDVLDGMQQLANRCRETVKEIKGATVLDIGCNDGSLLTIFSKMGVKTIGVEPTDAYLDAVKAGHIVFNEYFNDNVATKIVQNHGYPDVITFTNVFAHIENLGDVIKALGRLINDTNILIIENHYLGSIISQNQFDTFYHEHPRSYSATSFFHIAERLAMNILSVDFPERYGGNIRVILSRKTDGSLVLNAPSEEDFFDNLSKIQDNILPWKKAKRHQIELLVEKFGPLPAKAFPGRAAILVKLLELDVDLISKVYEKPGSIKIGHYVPGTRIPIVSDTEMELDHLNKGPLINFAWHISSEIQNYMRKIGYTGQIFDIFAPSEFHK